MATDLTAQIKALARRAGFDLVGVTTPEPLAEAEAGLRAALAEGRLQALPWMTAERIHLATHPREWFPPARSVLCVGMGYLSEPSITPRCHSERAATGCHSERAERTKNLVPSFDGDSSATALPQNDSEPTGLVARYAWGEDYHAVLRRQLRALLWEVEAMLGRPIAARIAVDTAPLAERALARRAGLGWQGRNTLLIAPGLGSWFVLGETLWDLDLEPDPPATGDCGDCDLCLRACPTRALVAPYTLNVARCLSYLTIEQRGDIPADLHSLLGDRLFGCDACQEACPHNTGVRSPNYPAFAARFGPRLPLAPLLDLTEAGFAARFTGSALRRAGVDGLRRNVRAVRGDVR